MSLGAETGEQQPVPPEPKASSADRPNTDSTPVPCEADVQGSNEHAAPGGKRQKTMQSFFRRT